MSRRAPKSITRAALDRLDAAIRETRLGPVLRMRNGFVWTMATDGCALIAIRGKHTRRIGGPRNIIAQLGAFEPGRLTSRKRFVKFLSEPVEENSAGTEMISVAGVKLDRSLIRRLIRGFDCEHVYVRAGSDRYKGMGTVVSIEGGDAFAICMGCVGDSPARARYRFGEPRRARGARQ